MRRRKKSVRSGNGDDSENSNIKISLIEERIW